MIKLMSISILMVLLANVHLAWAQDPQGESGQAQQPAPAYGSTTQDSSAEGSSSQASDNQVPGISENPPISGLDLPNLEPHSAPLSYLQPGAHVSESVDSNIENSLGGSKVGSISRAEGSLDMHRLWSNYDLSLDYLGGVGYYNVRGIGLRQVEELGFYQKVTWKRGEFGIRDAFSYQPEGTFGSSYGALGDTGAGLTEVGAFFGGTALGGLGQVPRIMNLTLADAVETLTPKSSVTATVGYGFIHFLQNEPGTDTSFIGSSQISGQLGYSRILGPHDQAAIVYGYQNFHFSTGITFYSNLIQLMWGHRISGRLDFLVGAGPQFTEFNHLLEPVTSLSSADTIPPCTFTDGTIECPASDFRISAAGRALLRYRFPKASLSASYEHYLTSGSGFFAGAESDVARVDVSRPLGRVWSGFADLGYSRNSRVTSDLCSASAVGCPGVSADVYQYGFVGGGLHRMFGRNFHGYVSYQFNELAFDHSYCEAAPGACNRISNRQVGTIGLDWTPRPIRLD
jgi:hypothetical protein